MSISHRRAIPRRSPQVSGHGVLLSRVALALCLLSVVACASGNVTTSTGAVVPAATVQTQDNVADVLHTLRAAQSDLVARFEATKATMTAEERARQYGILIGSADGLDASQAALVAWKRQSAGATPSSVLAPIVAQAPALLRLAVQAHVLTEAQANFARGILGLAVTP